MSTADPSGPGPVQVMHRRSTGDSSITAAATTPVRSEWSEGRCWRRPARPARPLTRSTGARSTRQRTRDRDRVAGAEDRDGRDVLALDQARPADARSSRRSASPGPGTRPWWLRRDALSLRRGPVEPLAAAVADGDDAVGPIEPQIQVGGGGLERAGGGVGVVGHGGGGLDRRGGWRWCVVDAAVERAWSRRDRDRDRRSERTALGRVADVDPARVVAARWSPDESTRRLPPRRRPRSTAPAAIGPHPPAPLMARSRSWRPAPPPARLIQCVACCPANGPIRARSRHQRLVMRPPPMRDGRPVVRWIGRAGEHRSAQPPLAAHPAAEVPLTVGVPLPGSPSSSISPRLGSCASCEGWCSGSPGRA